MRQCDNAAICLKMQKKSQKLSQTGISPLPLPEIIFLMFSRYLRSYPWWLQLVLFVLMIFTLISLMTAVIYVLPKFTGVSLEDIGNLNEHSPRPIIDAALLYQAISSVGVFLLS